MSQIQKTLSLFGATGSVGQSCLDYIRAQKNFQLFAISAHQQYENLIEIALEFLPQKVIISDETHYHVVRDALVGTGVEVLAGEGALGDVARERVDVVLNAIVGASGLGVTLSALEAGQTLALANKESLVVAGELVMATAKAHGGKILPVDSEHSALFQLLEGKDQKTLKSVTLTASGGPFRTWSAEQIKFAPLEKALNHPTWNMGAKISIDSATLMNKGLELIEAKYLFDLAPEQLDVIVHPQSLVHAMVSFVDGQSFLHAAVADMKVPIAYALQYPQRCMLPHKIVDFAHIGALAFEAPDRERFPCLALAEDALRAGGALPCVLNAANEVAVQYYLQKQIAFHEIALIVESSLENAERKGLHKVPDSLAHARFVDHEARLLAVNAMQSVQRVVI